jgi:hypothetical protein
VPANRALQLSNASVAALPLAFAAERHYRYADDDKIARHNAASCGRMQTRSTGLACGHEPPCRSWPIDARSDATVLYWARSPFTIGGANFGLSGTRAQAVCSGSIEGVCLP